MDMTALREAKEGEAVAALEKTARNEGPGLIYPAAAFAALEMLAEAERAQADRNWRRWVLEALDAAPA
jgi:hypothetical protein